MVSLKREESGGVLDMISGQNSYHIPCTDKFSLLCEVSGIVSDLISL